MGKDFSTSLVIHLQDPLFINDKILLQLSLHQSCVVSIYFTPHELKKLYTFAALNFRILMRSVKNERMQGHSFCSINTPCDIGIKSIKIGFL